MCKANVCDIHRNCTNVIQQFLMKEDEMMIDDQHTRVPCKFEKKWHVSPKFIPIIFFSFECVKRKTAMETQQICYNCTRFISREVNDLDKSGSFADALVNKVQDRYLSFVKRWVRIFRTLNSDDRRPIRRISECSYDSDNTSLIKVPYFFFIFLINSSIRDIYTCSPHIQQQQWLLFQKTIYSVYVQKHICKLKSNYHNFPGDHRSNKKMIIIRGSFRLSLYIHAYVYVAANYIHTYACKYKRVQTKKISSRKRGRSYIYSFLYQTISNAHFLISKKYIYFYDFIYIYI